MGNAKILEFNPEQFTPEQMSIYEIMLEAQNAETGDVDLSKEALEKLGELFKTKVDAYQYYFDSEDALIAEKQGRIDVLMTMIARHQTAIDQAQARRDKAEEFLIASMKRFGYEKLAGNDWAFSLRKYPKLEITDPFYKNPNEKIWEAFPDLVRRKESEVTFEWNKNELKKRVEDGSIKVNFAKIDPNEKLQTKSKGR